MRERSSERLLLLLSRKLTNRIHSFADHQSTGCDWPTNVYLQDVIGRGQPIYRMRLAHSTENICLAEEGAHSSLLGPQWQKGFLYGARITH